jgi:lipoprotein-anchoring transpeptidase ErfK/SrfK
MVDYYSALLRVVTAPDAGDAQWRHAVYDRARQMLAERMRTQRPPASFDEAAAETAAFESAIERIETELAWTEREALPGQSAADERGPIAAPSRFRRATWIVLAVVAAALAAGGYVYRAQRVQQPAAVTNEAHNTVPAPAKPVKTARDEAMDDDLAPGIDGGSSDHDQPYVFRRQPTFYRTLQPVGTIIVDKLQHFLYVILPNNVALRYGIGVGNQCKDLAGLRHIASMTEWPPWQPPPDLLKRNPSAMPGGPGNPLGARLLDLDDGSSRIHGTNAPKTIGNFVALGCIRLVNDDITDLYNRVRVSTPVLVN